MKQRNTLLNMLRNFQQYETIISFGDGIFTHKITIVEAEEDQSNLLNNIAELNNKS